MMWATALLAAALVAGATPDVKNQHLARGIELFEATDYAGALQALTQALDQPSSKRDFARIHLYIGMIQHRYKLRDDAQASFTKALDYDPKVKLPKSATKGAKELFLKLRKAKLGDAAEPEKKRKGVFAAKRKSDSEGAAESAVRTSSVAREAGFVTAPPEPSVEHGGAEKGAVADRGAAGADRAVWGDGEPSRDAAAESALVKPPSEAVAVGPPQNPPIAGWVAVGVGIASGAVGLTFAVLSAKNGNDALDPSLTANRAEQLHDRAVQQRTVSIVSFAACGVALGVAAIVFLTR